jgi:hypothetical protein
MLTSIERVELLRTQQTKEAANPPTQVDLRVLDILEAIKAVH